MALNFPNSPTIGQIYTDTTSGFSYEWDGTVWRSYTPASSSNIKILDDISGSFNGSTDTFALTSSGVSIVPANPQSLLISVGGVLQEPSVDYTVSSTNIVFTTAPQVGLTFSGVSLGPAIPITYANDGNVYVRKTYTGAGTTGPFDFSEGYTVGYLDVYRNGVRLSSGTDFVGTSGTNFFLSDAASVGDELEAIGYSVASLVASSSNLNTLNVTGISTLTNVNVSGVITATSFVGNGSGLTGISSVSFATTSFGLSGTPNINVGIATITTELDVGVGGTIFTALPTGRVGIATLTPPTNLYVQGTAAGNVVGLGTTTGTVTLNFAQGNNFSMTLVGSITLANPTGITTGQSGIIQIQQDSVGSRTVGFGSFWRFPSGTAPTVSTASTQIDCITYFVRASNSIIANSLIGMGLT